MTRDHLIPKWVIRTFHQFRSEDNIVPSCQNCNSKKGAMPPALYAAVRGSARHRAKAHIYWSGVASWINLRGPAAEDVVELRNEVVDMFRTLIPTGTGIYDPRYTAGFSLWPGPAPEKTTAELFAIADAYRHLDMATRTSLYVTAQDWKDAATPETDAAAS